MFQLPVEGDGIDPWFLPFGRIVNAPHEPTDANDPVSMTYDQQPLSPLRISSHWAALLSPNPLFFVFKIMKMETDLITEDFDLAIAAVADRRRVAGIVEGVDLQVQRQALREEIN